MKGDEVDLHKEFNSGYCIHLASHEGRSVVIKTFKGSRAKQVSTFQRLLLLRRRIEFFLGLESKCGCLQGTLVSSLHDILVAVR